MASSERVSSVISARVSDTLVAAVFCSIWSLLVVPGMGTIQGLRARSHASAICPGAAFFLIAQDFSSSTSCKLCGRFSVYVCWVEQGVGGFVWMNLPEMIGSPLIRAESAKRRQCPLRRLIACVALALLGHSGFSLIAPFLRKLNVNLI